MRARCVRRRACGIAVLFSTYGATCLELSPLESLALRGRLGDVAAGVRAEYGEAAALADADTFIFPGAGGVDELVRELQATTPRSRIVDWKEYRGSVLTAAFDGEAVGETVAELVLSSRGAKVQRGIHFVGISVGGFCANAAARHVATAVTDDDDNRPDVRLTLLDPFCGRGVLDPFYGRRQFGRYATTAVHILNTDDPVPTTNDPLPHCFCIDVTGAPERNAFVPPKGDTMHSWPVAYYARHFASSPWVNGPFPKGQIRRIR